MRTLALTLIALTLNACNVETEETSESQEASSVAPVEGSDHVLRDVPTHDRTLVDQAECTPVPVSLCAPEPCNVVVSACSWGGGVVACHRVRPEPYPEECPPYGDV